MKLWLLLPVKPLDEAKSRLAATLSPQARSELVERLLARTIRLAQRTQRFAQIAVISRDEDVLASTMQLGAMPLAEAGADLNAALDQGCAAAQAGGADLLLILPTDLPILEESDLEAVVALAQAGADVVMAASRDGGTNALLLRLPPAFAFAFGPNSFAAHHRAARAAGCQVAVYASPTLAFDLDWPADLTQLADAPGSG